ncbi:MICOS complex subunit MIC13 [Trichostrongylus colubriformis]|uniref:MICOS complex subunit MIC13 n=1 Tax=Trichostrongylus colubriformis TaxID=6319 RepID=A0AAN8J0A8_TRICO
MGFLWSVSKFSIKVALVAGAVKLSIDNDIWSLSTASGANLYRKLKQYIVPGTIVFPENLPSVEEVQTDVGHAWNNGVEKVFTAVQSAPSSINAVANRMIGNK